MSPRTLGTLTGTGVATLVLAVAPAWGSGRSAEVAPGTTQDPVYVRQLAEGRYLDGELEAAAELYFEVARLTEETSERSSALVNAAWLHHLLDDREQALATLRAALRVDPTLELDVRLYSPDFEKVYLKARVLAIRDGGTRPAPDSAPIRRQAPDTPARAAYRQGLERLRLGDDKGALELLQRAAALTYGGDAEVGVRRSALLRIGLLYYERGQWSDAANAFAEAVPLDRTDVSAWSNLGLAHAKQGDDAAAVGAFREAYTRRPGAIENARHLAQALLRLERWDEAASWISDAVRHHERDAHLQLLLAEAHQGRGATDRAVGAWRAATELDDSFDWEYGRQAAVWLGLTALEATRWDDAQAIAERALERDRQDAGFWNLLGLAQQGRGDAAAARLSFQRACEHDERRAEYRNNLGRAYAAIGDLPQAEREFVYALTLEPDLPAAQSNLAQVRKLLNDSR